jgi:hypothetical protein
VFHAGYAIVAARYEQLGIRALLPLEVRCQSELRSVSATLAGSRSQSPRRAIPGTCTFAAMRAATPGSFPRARGK